MTTARFLEGAGADGADGAGGSGGAGGAGGAGGGTGSAKLALASAFSESVQSTTVAFSSQNSSPSRVR